MNARPSANFTPLHVAALCHRVGGATAVPLKHGADPNAKTEKGRTTVDLAHHKGHTGVEIQIMALEAALQSGGIEPEPERGGDG